jgi:F-type H+-transporting ATPase subunit epsilon
MGLFLNIISPEKQLFEGEITSVTLPGTKGLFTILPGHAPIISSLRKGTLKYVVHNGEDEHELAIKGGFIEMSNGMVTVCLS